MKYLILTNKQFKELNAGGVTKVVKNDIEYLIKKDIDDLGEVSYHVVSAKEAENAKTYDVLVQTKNSILLTQEQSEKVLNGETILVKKNGRDYGVMLIDGKVVANRIVARPLNEIIVINANER